MFCHDSSFRNTIFLLRKRRIVGSLHRHTGNDLPCLHNAQHQLDFAGLSMPVNHLPPCKSPAVHITGKSQLSCAAGLPVPCYGMCVCILWVLFVCVSVLSYALKQFQAGECKTKWSVDNRQLRAVQLHRYTLQQKVFYQITVAAGCSYTLWFFVFGVYSAAAVKGLK